MEKPAPKFSDELLEDIIEAIVERDGEQITSEDIKYIFGIKDSTANPITRSAIKEAIKKYAIPQGIEIGACSSGYFLIKTDEERSAYVRNLTKRAIGIMERIQMVVDAAQMGGNNERETKD